MKNTDIRKQLEAMHASDQKAIRDFRSGKLTACGLEKLNNRNISKLKKIIHVYGFPKIRDTSYEAYKAAFLVALHSQDIELMKSFALFLERSPADEVEKPDFGYMTDKIRVCEGKPQIFGTQFRKEHGKITFLEIEDHNGLEARRAALGMESFSEYKKKAEDY